MFARVIHQFRVTLTGQLLRPHADAKVKKLPPAAVLYEHTQRIIRAKCIIDRSAERQSVQLSDDNGHDTK